MTITYRGDGAWGSGKGANLTAAEMDANFYDLDQRISALEASLPAAKEIASVSVSGSSLSIALDDSTVYGPFPLSSATFNIRGEWAPSTAYGPMDLVRVDGGSYIVLETHTSASTFDPTEGGTSPYYSLIAQDATTTRGVNLYTTTTQIKPTLSQANAYFRLDAASGTKEFVLPPPSGTGAVAFPLGTEFLLAQWDAAVWHVYGASGVDTYGASGSTFRTTGIGTVLWVKKIGDWEWDVIQIA